jgi:hypothetical protein
MKINHKKEDLKWKNYRLSQISICLKLVSDKSAIVIMHERDNEPRPSAVRNEEPWPSAVAC